MADKQMWAKPGQRVEPWWHFFTQIYAQTLKKSIEKLFEKQLLKVHMDFPSPFVLKWKFEKWGNTEWMPLANATRTM